MEGLSRIFFFKKTWLAAVLLAVSIGAIAQVQRGAYRLMLQKLLSHSVPEAQVPAVATDTLPIVFLDAREPKEFNISHLAGAIAVGYDSFDLKKIPSGIDKKQKIVVYCSVGYRSEKVAEKLIAAGYANVSNLYGGIFEWVNQGHPVVDQNGPTQRVHAYDRAWGVWLRKGKKVY